MTGIVTIVQEGRFQMTDPDGVSHLFILSPKAALEPAQLQALQRQQAKILVHYTAAKNIIGNIATALSSRN